MFKCQICNFLSLFESSKTPKYVAENILVFFFLHIAMSLALILTLKPGLDIK